MTDLVADRLHPVEARIEYFKPALSADRTSLDSFQGDTARVRIHRAHLEYDVGKSTHFERHSGVDFNRARSKW